MHFTLTPFVASVLSVMLSSSSQQTSGSAEAIPSRQVAQAKSRVTHIACNVKGTVLVTATESGDIAAWNVAKEEPLWLVAHPRLSLCGLAIGTKYVIHARKEIAAAGVIDAETGVEQTGVGGPAVMQQSTAVVCDSRDRWLWLGTDSGSLQRLVVGNVQGWSTRSIGNGGVAALALEPGGDLLAVGGRDHSIRFVNAASANVDDKKVLAGHTAPVTALALGSKGNVLISGSEDKTVRVWNVASGKSKLVLAGHAAAVRTVAVDSKGERCASGDDQGVVKLWSLSEGSEVATLEHDASGPATGLVFLDKGKTLAAAAGGNCVMLWDLSRL